MYAGIRKKFRGLEIQLIIIKNNMINSMKGVNIRAIRWKDISRKKRMES